jgi:hypothetical protein
MDNARQGKAGAVIAPPGHTARSPADTEALFAAARRRRRKRRLTGGVACLVLAGSAAAGLTAAWPAPGTGTHQEQAGHPAVPHPSSLRLPPVRVAWVDDGGQLHIGDLATGAQQVVATVDASPGDPMTEVGGRLCWADINKRTAPIRCYDIATSKIRYLPGGNSVFASADGQRLYIVQTNTTLIELPADGIGFPRRLALPAGWYMSGLLGNWSVAGGVIVYSADDASSTSTLATWNPETGNVKIIGRDLTVIDTYTPAGARYSLLAWTSHGTLGITNTSTLASLTVRSPSRYGFTYGGLFTSDAFSPDGTQLAVFLNTTSPQDSSHEPVSEPAIVDTRTGVLRLIHAARLGTYEDAGWGRWLPGGHQLIVGAEQGSYSVDAVTLSVRPLVFALGSDINFSATVLASPQPSQRVSASPTVTTHTANH